MPIINRQYVNDGQVSIIASVLYQPLLFGYREFEDTFACIFLSRTQHC